MKKGCYRTEKQIHLLFRQLGVLYLPRSRVDFEPLLSARLDRTPYYRANREEFESLARLYGDAIRAAAIAPIYIQRVDDTIGLGVFAAAPIQKDAFIGEYAGVVQVAGKDEPAFTAESGHESDYSWYYLDKPKGLPELEINGRQEGNEMRFVNHGNPPNLKVEHTLIDGQWVLFFVAGRDIEKDEELLISYGNEYWEGGFRSLADNGG
ncbi:MAG: SET domain-containing protein-lysine N-methyltransferase [Thermodesulfobacteriota bacterium]|nr:SET domain-containing protein-lysine N-methyltransferase [Thermodesulfobacteriota bacterium]